MLHGSTRSVSASSTSSGANASSTPGQSISEHTAKITGHRVRSLPLPFSRLRSSFSFRSLPAHLPFNKGGNPRGLSAAHHQTIPAVARPPPHPHHQLCRLCLHLDRRQSGWRTRRRLEYWVSSPFSASFPPVPPDTLASYLCFISIASFLLWYRCVSRAAFFV